MGYSKSTDCIIRMKALLDQMLVAESDIAWPSNNAHMLGYNIREALTVASKLPDSPYRELKAKWVIRNKGNRILAEKKDVDIMASMKKAIEKITLDEPDSLVAVVGAAITHKAHEMYFPNAFIETEEVNNLYKWCQKNMYYLIVSDNGITLTRDDPQEAAWTPE